MRFVKLLVALLSLGLSGQALAAKTTVIGTGTTDSSGLFTFSLPIAWFHNTVHFETSVPLTTFVRTDYTEKLCYQHHCPEPSFLLHLSKQSETKTTTNYDGIYGTGYTWTWYHGDRSKVIGGSSEATLFASADPFTEFDYTLTYAPIPEPSTWTLMILGFGAAGFAMRRRVISLRHEAPAV